ncbi:MAG: glycoside hydrolase family 16 protein [Bacteroidetes bacterium]|nr:glycoside hydrolase family 16 protein [Bacteroidota bacterium]
MRNFFYLFLMLCMLGCKQSDPQDVLGRVGDIVTFSGRKWDVKSSVTPVGPGPNVFSKRYDDVWVDDKGYLHLTIDQHDNQWYSSEVVSQENLGYGTYTWTIQADPMSFAENVVLGLFTWDNNTFITDGNSEVDIEFSKWGDPMNVAPTTYSVQPVSFGSFYAERTRKKEISNALLKGVTTHQFHWTDSLITWMSFRGSLAIGEPIASWSFDLNHPPRVKVEGGVVSNPIVIPSPGLTTNARMNFWTLPYQSLAPLNGVRHEVVIQRFTYEP